MSRFTFTSSGNFELAEIQLLVRAEAGLRANVSVIGNYAAPLVVLTPAVVPTAVVVLTPVVVPIAVVLVEGAEEPYIFHNVLVKPIGENPSVPLMFLD